MRDSLYRRCGKRALDLLASVPAVVLMLPLYLLVSACVLACLGRPILFRQVRPGLHGRPFTLLKFRTMRICADAQGRALPDAARLTPFGRVLRSTSLDELPELWNVLHGDMSLVGPRPLLPQYLDRYSPEQARRHAVRPGLTGWAQVHGRNAIGWEEKFALDTWYVDHMSLRLDLCILLRTLFCVLRQGGIHAAGEATMAEFQGSPTSGPGNR
jgi:lipopolysaccharide/colanic/teichoic acid biosynthesis glycosyltransferase